ncbi:MFS transporter [Yersinia enterocolitica]|nr:MFS transporter [Yersinia enterocolitica]HEC4989299.1 MFS transporter [Yersinia enterocolitica]HEN3334836.1 MFS transporter [Yersinia enterocolitica]
MSPNDKSELLSLAIKKSVRRLLPFLAMMYIMAYLDRANIGFAKDTFQLDTGLSNAAYAFGAGIFFIGYAIFEVPSNIFMFKYGARIWLARIMVTWGAISSLMMFANSKVSFYVLRFLLGACEAGFMPGVMLYLTFWFPINVRAKVAGFFWFGPPLAFILGGPLSGGLLSMHGAFGLHGWQIMFLITGLLTILVGIWAYFYLDDRPSDERCTWLTQQERDVLCETMNAEEHDKLSHGPKSILQALLDPKVIFLCLIAFTIQVGSYGIAFFLPTQVANILGTKVGFLVGVVTGIPWLCALIAAYYIPHFSTVIRERRWVASLTLFAGAAGVAGSAMLAGTPLLAFIALCIGCAGLLAVQPIFWTFPTGYLGGAAAASGIALINSLANLGGFVAPNIRVWAENTFNSSVAGLYLLGAIALVGSVMILAVYRLGIGKQEERHRAAPLGNSQKASQL